MTELKMVLKHAKKLIFWKIITQRQTYASEIIWRQWSEKKRCVYTKNLVQRITQRSKLNNKGLKGNQTIDSAKR